MALLVLKFGGTSLGNTSRIKNACEIISSHNKAGNDVVVVVSAMSGVTDQLVSLIKDISTFESGNNAEHDVIMSSGENVSAGLVSIALNSIGLKARSWLGWQLPIKVSGPHNNADIVKINGNEIMECLRSGVIPVIAGFQGERENKLYTLGRGGTDTTAVAVAAELKADKCYIYTDVEGVFSSDPRVIPKVKKLDTIAFDQMLELSENGAKVLHPKAVKIAQTNKINLEVLSSFTNKEGTAISDDEFCQVGDLLAISSDSEYAHVSFSMPRDFELSKESLDIELMDLGVEIKLSNQVIGDQFVDINFVVRAKYINKLQALLENYSAKQCKLDISKDISLICLVGRGFANDKYNVEKVFEIIKHSNVDILSTELSDISLKLVVKSADVSSIIREIHNQFGLDFESYKCSKEDLNESFS